MSAARPLPLQSQELVIFKNRTDVAMQQATEQAAQLKEAAEEMQKKYENVSSGALSYACYYYA